MLSLRLTAGTLQDGKCTAAEEAWSAIEFQHFNYNSTAAQAALKTSWAALFGYEQFMRTTLYVLRVLSNASMFAAECSDTQFHSFAKHIVHAAELMQQPRRHGNVGMGVEARFADALRRAVVLADASGLDARLVQLLAGAWQRLQRSGVLEERHTEKGMARIKPGAEALEAALDKSLNSPGLRSCALPGCGAREAHPAHFKSCAACRAVVYCCREHQVEGWPAHKKACKAARKAAAADDEAGPSGA